MTGRAAHSAASFMQRKKQPLSAGQGPALLA